MRDAAVAVSRAGALDERRAGLQLRRELVYTAGGFDRSITAPEDVHGPGADADLVPNYNGQKSRLDYTIRTRLEDLTADIRGADTRMTRGSGTARVNRNTVELDLSGDLVASVANAEGEPATAPDASLRATIQLPPGADWGDLRTSDDDEQGDPFGGARADTPVRPRIDAAVVLPSADLAIPAEPIVALFSASAADTLRDLRTRYRPEGRLGVTTTIRGTLGDAFGEGVSQGRLRKVLVHLLGATVDPSHYMTDDVDYLIVGANASGPKIQKADCSPTTEIILAADVLAVLRRDDTKEAVRLWRESQAELAYFWPEDLRFLEGRVGFVTGGLRGFTKDEGLAAVFRRYGATLILPTDKHSRSKADFCVHGDLDDSNGLDVARINQIPVVRADALLDLGFGSDAAPPRSAFGTITNVAGREPPRKRSRP